MIKSIAIENFQAYKDAFLLFDEGVNVITGSSDSGKSTIIRAFCWNKNNRPSGEDFKNWSSSKKDSVIVEVETDNHTVTIIRENSKTKYVIDNDYKNPLEAIKTDVPNEVSSILNLDEYNLQTQFDPYFLLQNSSGEVAKRLNEYADMEVIDTLFSNINSEIRSSNTNIASLTNTKNALENDLVQFKNLDTMKKAVERLIEKSQISEEITASLNELSKNIEALESLKSEKENYSPVATLEPLIDKLLLLSNESISLSDKINDLQTVLDNIDTVQEDIVLAKDVIFMEDSYISLVAKRKEQKELETRITGLKDCFKIFDNIRKHSDIEKEKKNTAVKQYVEMISKEKKCPVCSSDIKESTIKRIKEDIK